MATCKVLTIDDEASIRQSIRTFLEDYGFTVLEAENGKQGIDVFNREQPDLVLLDLRMPEMDGLQVLEELNGRAPDVPMVVASGTGNIDALVRALHLGAWDYVLKPIEDLEILYHSIERCLKESRLKRENKAYQKKLEALVARRTRALEQSRKQYEAIFEYTGTAAVILEPDDTISMANAWFSDLAGMPRKDIEGKMKWFDFIPPGDVATLENYLRERDRLSAAKDTSPVQYEIVFLDAAGNKKHVYASLGKIPGTDRHVASLLDMTEKIQAEKKWRRLEKQFRTSQRMEAIGTLAGGIAHDLNNILSPVLGYADMIQRTTDPGDSNHRRSEKIRKAAFRAADLVNQVLTFSRGGNAEEKRVVKLHPLLAEVVKLLRCSVPSTIKIVDDVDRKCGPVLADPTQIHQVIMNLCTNAFHAMEDTGGRLVVSLRSRTLTRADIMKYPGLHRGGGQYMVIQVADTGCGMGEDVLDRIFDPYFTTKEEGKGTGLGLTTAYRIVRDCKGDIHVETRPGQGTVFTVLLPAADQGPQGDHVERPDPDNILGKGERVLVVDDDPDVAFMCKEGFEVLGYTATAFTSSIEALDYFTAQPRDIDVVVTDLTMPEKTGIELAKDIAAVNPDVPVILCSGHAGSVSRQVWEGAGIKKFMMKPVTVETLSREIKKLLARPS